MSDTTIGPAASTDAPKTSEAFGERVARLMKAKGLSQTALAKRTGIERTQLNRLIRGHRQPHTDEIAWLAEALAVSPPELLDGIELPPKVQKAIDEFRELARRVLAAERRGDEATAKVAAVEARSAADATKWAGEREALQRALAEQKAETERVRRAAASQLSTKDEENRSVAGQLVLQQWHAEQDKAALQASNDWLQARVRQLEAQLAAQQSNAVAATVGVGGLALLLGIGLGGKS